MDILQVDLMWDMTKLINFNCDKEIDPKNITQKESSKKILKNGTGCFPCMYNEWILF